MGEWEVEGSRRSCCFIHALHCDHCAISNHSAAYCRRISATLKATGVGHFVSNICGVPFGADPWSWGVQRANTPG